MPPAGRSTAMRNPVPLCIYFIITFFIIALFTIFTIQLKKKDGSVGSPPIEGTQMADQSRKHPFAQLNSLSLNIGGHAQSDLGRMKLGRSELRFHGLRVW